jgi:hypothetical protein
MQPLLAQVTFQTAHAQEHFAWGAFLMTALSAAVLLLLVFTVVALWHHGSERERDHIERMRMIEMGLPVPPHDRSAWPKALVGVAIGAGVPLVAFTFTFFAFTARSDVADELWVAPGVVSGLSVIAASLLTAHLFRWRAVPDAATAGQKGRKPAMDPDAFDVAASRG